MSLINQDNQTYNFYVESEIERLNYLITASEENTFCFVSILDDNREEVCEFKSKLSLTENEDLELVISRNKSNEEIHFLKQNAILKIDFNLDGIQTHAECFVREFESIEDNIIINISAPFKMIRVQRRVHPRITVPSSFEIFVTLDKNKEELSRLRAVNISLGGIAVLASASQQVISNGMIFHNSFIELPFKVNNIFQIPMKISYAKLINKEILPQDLIDKDTRNSWYHLGIKFENSNVSLEDSIKMAIYQISKNN
jgi:c-di-GMP-binding flagellar brake protein YcgR